MILFSGSKHLYPRGSWQKLRKKYLKWSEMGQKIYLEWINHFFTFKGTTAFWGFMILQLSCQILWALTSSYPHFSSLDFLDPKSPNKYFENGSTFYYWFLRGWLLCNSVSVFSWHIGSYPSYLLLLSLTRSYPFLNALTHSWLFDPIFSAPYFLHTKFLFEEKNADTNPKK